MCILAVGVSEVLYVFFNIPIVIDWLAIHALVVMHMNNNTALCWRRTILNYTKLYTGYIITLASVLILKGNSLFSECPQQVCFNFDRDKITLSLSSMILSSMIPTLDLYCLYTRTCPRGSRFKRAAYPKRPVGYFYVTQFCKLFSTFSLKSSK